MSFLRSRFKTVKPSLEQPKLQRWVEWGIKEFRWEWVDADHDCPQCIARDGEIYKVSSNDIFPGDGSCCPDGICKCIALPVIEGLID